MQHAVIVAAVGRHKTPLAFEKGLVLLLHAALRVVAFLGVLSLLPRYFDVVVVSFLGSE